MNNPAGKATTLEVSRETLEKVEITKKYLEGNRQLMQTSTGSTSRKKN